MARILVSGLVNLEMSVRVPGFPIPYTPLQVSPFGIQSSPAGIGYNLAKALTTLGDTVHLVSTTGSDLLGKLLREILTTDGISDEFVTGQLGETNQSAVFFDSTGRRAIFSDPKDTPGQCYPPALFECALAGCCLATIGMASIFQPLVGLARQAGVPVACDLHTHSDLTLPYLQPLLSTAAILFLSAERLGLPPEEWVRQALPLCAAQVIVIGMAHEGALLAERSSGKIQRCPAATAPNVVNTTGAGDALFSAFLHFYCAGLPAEAALARAQIFAAHKISKSGASQGFLSETEVNQLCAS